MNLLICSTRYGGCGHIGNSEDWKRVDTGTDDINGIIVDGLDVILCPKCQQDHALALIPENYIELTDNNNCREAEKRLNSLPNNAKETGGEEDETGI